MPPAAPLSTAAVAAETGRAACANRRCLPPGRPDAATRSAPTLLLLHGSAGTSAIWKDVRKATPSGFRILAPDLIGYGASAPPPRGDGFSLADEIASFEPDLPCRDCGLDVVGYSYGGAVAMAMALADPARIRSLTLVEPVIFPALALAGEHAPYARFVEMHREFSTLLREGRPEAAMRGFIDAWTGAGAWDRLTAAARQAMLACAPKIELDWRASFAADLPAPQLKGLAGATLLVRGDRSPEPMIALVDALHGLMPGSERLVVEGANHLLPLSHGRVLGEAIAARLQRNQAIDPEAILGNRENDHE